MKRRFNCKGGEKLINRKKMAEEKEIGEVTHYYNKIGVAVIRITTGELKAGDTIHIQGHTTDFVQDVASMQIEHKDVSQAKSGDEFGVKVDQPVRDGDKVHLVK